MNIVNKNIDGLKPQEQDQIGSCHNRVTGLRLGQVTDSISGSPSQFGHLAKTPVSPDQSRYSVELNATCDFFYKSCLWSSKNEVVSAATTLESWIYRFLSFQNRNQHPSERPTKSDNFHTFFRILPSWISECRFRCFLNFTVKFSTLSSHNLLDVGIQILILKFGFQFFFKL